MRKCSQNFKIAGFITTLLLALNAYVLYEYSLCPMWMVIVPLVVAAAAFVLLLFKCEKLPFVAWIASEAALAATAFFLYRYTLLPVWLLVLPSLISLVAMLGLILGKGNLLTAAACVSTVLAALLTYLLYSYTLVSMVLVFAPLVFALVAFVCHLVLRCNCRKACGVVAVVAALVGLYLLKQNSILPALVQKMLLLATLAVLVVLLIAARWDSIKESIRKSVVSLKRSPQRIPLIMLFVAFLYYSLNLTDVSDTTAKIQLQGMGLCQFCIMLFSLLSLVCMLNAFPRRKKANVPMVILMYVMFAVIIYCDTHYNNAILTAVNRSQNPIPISDYIVGAQNMLVTHRILMIVTAALVALLPVYSKLLKKINTSVEIADNGDMGQIELND